jgi:hypothetical protein
VASLGAEIVVGDTGSTDATRQICDRFNATVIAIPWRDDFADAQNQVLAFAKGDWILWLNPDEELVAGTVSCLPNLICDKSVLAYAIRIRHVMAIEQRENAVETLEPRLFRKNASLRYVGRLHPHFATPLEVVAGTENKRISLCDVVVDRHAYTSIITPEKLRWATRLLELELQDRPGQVHYLIEYGRNLLMLQDSKAPSVMAEALELVLKESHAAIPSTPTIGALLEYFLGLPATQWPAHIHLNSVCELAIRWFAGSPPVRWALAKRSYGNGDFQDAAIHLESLIEFKRTCQFDRSLPFDPNILGDSALLNLGKCYIQLRLWNRAEACLGSLLSSPVHGQAAREALALVQQCRIAEPQ